MMLPTMEIPMPSAANGGFGGLGVDDLNAAAVHPAQILGAAAAAQAIAGCPITTHICSSARSTRRRHTRRTRLRLPS